MIHVRYDSKGPGIEIRGHACAGEYGKDLVCAAASVLMHTLRKTLGTDGTALMQDGRTAIESRSGKNREKFEVIFAGYEWLSENYPENVETEKI